ncbi:hypothetical protein F5Y18DRAFT_112988 [Xylariaceae sp. FL1019]|nr:hypothetical protein F5Y18DRAFT_112988 [Xylariaceae sp. FL1019]
MRQSWFLRCFLLITVAMGEAWAQDMVLLSDIESPSLVGRYSFSYATVVSEAPSEGNRRRKSPSQSSAGPIRSPREQAAAAMNTPQPTMLSSPEKRQDDGQVQALSSQLQALSQSATQAISSVSSSASSVISQMSQSSQSIQQSANQAIQQATQSAQQANQQLTQTQSSASSAVSAANSRASSQIAQSLSSMSSRISSNQASAASSASNAISSAQSVASQFAASQIASVRAAASGDASNTDSLMQQVRPNSISGTNVAIIVTVSVVGTAILSTASSYLFLRYRRKITQAREEVALADEKRSHAKTIAVRGSLTRSPSPLFKKLGVNPMDNFKLPKLSPLTSAKKNQSPGANKIGFATSDYSDLKETFAPAQNSSKPTSDINVGNIPSSGFRLQKNNGLSHATSVRLIRVGSDKSKTSNPDAQQQTSMSSIPRRPVASASENQPNEPTPDSDQLSAKSYTPLITQPPKAKEPPPEQPRASRTTADTTNDRRATIRSTVSSQKNLRFRDSSDTESMGPNSARLTLPPLRNTNTASLRTSAAQPNVPAMNGSNDISPPRRPKNAGASFATFPRVRAEPPRESMSNRGRPDLPGSIVAARLRAEEERRRRELAEIRAVGRGGGPEGTVEVISDARSSREMFDSR